MTRPLPYGGLTPLGQRVRDIAKERDQDFVETVRELTLSGELARLKAEIDAD